MSPRSEAVKLGTYVLIGSILLACQPRPSPASTAPPADSVAQVPPASAPSAPTEPSPKAPAVDAGTLVKAPPNSEPIDAGPPLMSCDPQESRRGPSARAARAWLAQLERQREAQERKAKAEMMRDFGPGGLGIDRNMGCVGLGNLRRGEYPRPISCYRLKMALESAKIATVDSCSIWVAWLDELLKKTASCETFGEDSEATVTATMKVFARGPNVAVAPHGAVRFGIQRCFDEQVLQLPKPPFDFSEGELSITVTFELKKN